MYSFTILLRFLGIILSVLRLEVPEGRGSSYTRMALYLIDYLFKTSFKEPVPPAVPNSGKRPRSESASSSDSQPRNSGQSGPPSPPPRSQAQHRSDRRDDRRDDGRDDDRLKRCFTLAGTLRGGHKWLGGGRITDLLHSCNKKNIFDVCVRG
jgi:hypothetical protein